MKAIIMAGGEGTRLRPLTSTIPKPMARIMNKPVMEHSILLLKKHGITDIGVTLMYLPEHIRAYFGDGSAWGVRLTYFLEETPLGTAGSVKNTGDFLDDDFLVISGDALTNADLSAFIAYHKAKRAEASLLLCPMDIPLSYGVVVTDGDGRIVRFLEKPTWSQVFSDTVNTGIYLLNPSVLKLCEKFPCDFSKDIFPRLLSENRPLFGYVSSDYWCDVGDLDAYRHCHYDIFSGKAGVKLDACRLAPGIYAEEGAVMEAGAVVLPPVLIGKNAHIKSGAKVDGYTVIGEGSVIEAGASIKRSVILDHVLVERNAQIRGSILCSHAHIGEGASLYEQSVIGEESRIGRDAVIKPGVRVWPSKAVGQGEILSQSLVWGTAKTPDLFTERGMRGAIGADLSPQCAEKLGSTIGTLRKGRIGIAADGSPASLMLKYAVQSGIMATGQEVVDFGNQPLPITRSGVKVYGLSAAVHAAARENTGFLEVIVPGGASLGAEEMQKLQARFIREDFARSEAQSIPPVTDAYEYKLYYLRQILKGTEKANGMRILAASASDWGRQLLTSAAAELGCTLICEEENITPLDTEKIRRFAERVPASGCAFGAILDELCESVLFIDERGRVIDLDLYGVLVSLLVMRKYKNARIFAAASAPTVIEELAARYGAAVIRTKDSPAARMQGLAGGDADLEAQFILHFDGVGAVIRILDFLHRENTTLSALIDEIPPFYVRRREVQCTHGDKGRIMRTLSEGAPETEKTEGVKFREKHGWVLILPDGEKAACRIIAHADREEYAAELTDIYNEKIKEILENKKSEK